MIWRNDVAGHCPSFLLCTVADVIPWLQDFHFLKALYPYFDWANPAMMAAVSAIAGPRL